jgi:hypothetical protein
VGTAKSAAVPITSFSVTVGGKTTPLKDLISPSPRLDGPIEELEHYVAVDWVKTFPITEAVKEKGFFGNQNIVARPRSRKWSLTIDRLRQRGDIP